MATSALTMITGAGSGAAPPAPPPDITFAAHSSLDLIRESTARSSDLLFDEPPAPAPAAAPPDAATEPTTRVHNLGLAAVLGLDIAADAVREARQIIFEPTAHRQLESASIGDQNVGTGGSASPESVADTVTGVEITVQFPWNAAFRARTVDINGATYGHILIRTFNVPDADGFVQEFIRLLEQMPESGLIFDVRGNGGGNIWAAERLLQTLAAAEIEPEQMQFIVTQARWTSPGTTPLPPRFPCTCGAVPWKRPLRLVAIYSHAFPLTSKESCNAIGQKYYGPVVLIVDGNCYSATDIFAAGFQDHRIGKILGVSTNTGAGGANVWEHRLLNEVLPFGWGLKPLPNQAGMRVAIRQCFASARVRAPFWRTSASCLTRTIGRNART